jgi:hypothetical protein
MYEQDLETAVDGSMHHATGRGGSRAADDGHRGR